MSHSRRCLDVLPEELFKCLPALLIVVNPVEPSQDDALVWQLLPVVVVPVNWHGEAHIICWFCPNHLEPDVSHFMRQLGQNLVNVAIDCHDDPLTGDRVSSFGLDEIRTNVDSTSMSIQLRSELDRFQGHSARS